MTKLPTPPPPPAPESPLPATRRATLVWLALVACVLLGLALFVAYGRDLLPLINDVP